MLDSVFTQSHSDQTVKQDIDTKHTDKATRRCLFMAKQWPMFDWPESVT